jgi:hypothetical protein
MSGVRYLAEALLVDSPSLSQILDSDHVIEERRRRSRHPQAFLYLNSIVQTATASFVTEMTSRRAVAGR